MLRLARRRQFGPSLTLLRALQPSPRLSRTLLLRTRRLSPKPNRKPSPRQNQRSLNNGSQTTTFSTLNKKTRNRSRVFSICISLAPSLASSENHANLCNFRPAPVFTSVERFGVSLSNSGRRFFSGGFTVHVPASHVVKGGFLLRKKPLSSEHVTCETATGAEWTMRIPPWDLPPIRLRFLIQCSRSRSSHVRPDRRGWLL
jgi:hypothetical protein